MNTNCHMWFLCTWLLSVVQSLSRGCRGDAGQGHRVGRLSWDRRVCCQGNPTQGCWQGPQFLALRATPQGCLSILMTWQLSSRPQTSDPRRKMGKTESTWSFVSWHWKFHMSLCDFCCHIPKVCPHSWLGEMGPTQEGGVA